MIYIDEVWTSVVRYATILRRGSPRAPAEELLQDKVLTDAGRSSDWAELRTWLGSGARAAHLGVPSRRKAWRGGSQPWAVAARGGARQGSLLR
eukprot:scaffold66042_cov58-Phaeocystis_antarctica.AAC.1